ncbi:MAG: PQQ-binding-like beta-propeller repeat protein [Euryarchaeota archaeon]|nr:PQQ-binding-like beta-propeller repeat protein [Euryarchaeota archaeon]
MRSLFILYKESNVKGKNVKNEKYKSIVLCGRGELCVKIMHKIIKTLGIIAILVLLTCAAQASDWPMFHHDARHTGYTTESIPDDLELLWSYKTGGGVGSSPAVANGKVFVGSHDSR